MAGEGEGTWVQHKSTSEGHSMGIQKTGGNDALVKAEEGGISDSSGRGGEGGKWRCSGDRSQNLAMDLILEGRRKVGASETTPRFLAKVTPSQYAVSFSLPSSSKK